jgi:hypothetical protein
MEKHAIHIATLAPEKTGFTLVFLQTPVCLTNQLSLRANHIKCERSELHRRWDATASRLYTNTC